MKPYRKPLKCGAPRLLSDHNGAAGDWYRGYYVALAGDLGPFTPFQSLEAGRTAYRWVQWRLAVLDLEAGQIKRARGKGRRPTHQDVERLKRREGLEDGSYASALEKLRDLCAANPGAKDFAARMAAAHRQRVVND